MPIYEYQCNECGHTLEKLQKVDAEPLTVCPECGKPALQKLISAAGFRLKGGGWYETDFKTGNKKNVSGGKSDTGSTSSGSSSSGSSDTGSDNKAKSGSDKKAESGKSTSGSSSAGSDGKKAS